MNMGVWLAANLMNLKSATRNLKQFISRKMTCLMKNKSMFSSCMSKKSQKKRSKKLHWFILNWWMRFVIQSLITWSKILLCFNLFAIIPSKKPTMRLLIWYWRMQTSSMIYSLEFTRTTKKIMSKSLKS